MDIGGSQVLEQMVSGSGHQLVKVLIVWFLAWAVTQAEMHSVDISITSGFDVHHSWNGRASN